MSSLVQNPSKSNDEDVKPSSWHHQNSIGASKMTNYPSGGSGMNSDGMNDSSNDANKANYNAMTKKRKAMHQANSSNRNSADENTSSKWVLMKLLADLELIFLIVPMYEHSREKLQLVHWAIFLLTWSIESRHSFFSLNSFLTKDLSFISPSHRDICKDLSVKVVPLDKLDPSVSNEYERHYKKVSELRYDSYKKKVQIHRCEIFR